MSPGGGEKETQPPPIPNVAAQKRLVIYTAQFSILVASVEDSMKTLIEKIKQWDGYVQTSDLKRVTFRVPAANFDRAVEEITRMGVATNKQIQAEDVTRHYTDLQLRIEVAEASRKRLMALLEKADKTEDLLKIENELRRLTEEIERMKGELRALADQIAYSTITVEFTAKAAEMKQPSPRRQLSYFNWINEIGAENVARYF
jgi:predicted  nucleic acid-binding Zn-ribbon protein